MNVEIMSPHPPEGPPSPLQIYQMVIEDDRPSDTGRVEYHFPDVFDQYGHPNIAV